MLIIIRGGWNWFVWRYGMNYDFRFLIICTEYRYSTAISIAKKSLSFDYSVQTIIDYY